MEKNYQIQQCVKGRVLMGLSVKDIAHMIDYSLLKPELTEEEVLAGLKLAKEYGVIAVCVKPCDVRLARAELAESDVMVTTVIGFPHGSNKTEVKVYEAKEAIADGAAELDMVLNIGRLRARDFEYVGEDIKAVVEYAHSKDVRAKVTFENCYLTEEQKVMACKLSEKAGADFVKTSTEFGTSGSTLEDIKLMKRVCGPHIQIKAAGGIRTLENALEVKKLGATRIGAAATKAILDEAKKREAVGILGKNHVVFEKIY